MIGFRRVCGLYARCSLRRIDASHLLGALLGLLALGLLAAAGATAAELTIYRCERDDGSVSLQDQPCPADAKQRTQHTRIGPDSSPRPISPAPATEEPAPPTEPTASPQTPPPALWQCVDLENRTRFADRDDPRGRWVPAWVVGADPRAPQRMFRDVGRPKPPPPRSGPGAPAAGAGVQPMVYVEDWCRELDARSACRVYRDLAREANRLRTNRVGSERDAAAAEAVRLHSILDAHCS